MQSIRKTLSVIFIIMLCCLLASCGESVSYSAAPPTNVTSPSPDDPTQNLFRFTTSDSENAVYGDNYKGTAIYYKIYTSESNLLSEQKSIVNAGKNNYETGISTMTSCGYQQMNGASFIIPKADYNRNVEIRLFDETTFSAGITAAGTKITDPTRNINGNFQFTNAYHPLSGDNDFRGGTQTSAGPWYVAAFACTVLQPTITYQLSPLTYLGYVKIYY